MDSKTFLGGSPMGVLIRLLVYSLVVGIVMNATGTDVSGLLSGLDNLLRSLRDISLSYFESLVGYVLLGATIVLPVWLISRLVTVARNRAASNSAGRTGAPKEASHD
jgi:Family of unknown function (DUF6460)